MKQRIFTPLEMDRETVAYMGPKTWALIPESIKKLSIPKRIQTKNKGMETYRVYVKHILPTNCKYI